MNKQGKGKIEWCDWSWNPIKGLCPVGCWYCYARRMYERFGMDRTVRLDPDELVRPLVLGHPAKIFVCSTFEIFHPEVDHYRDLIFQVIEDNPQHTFQVLTKMPERIDRAMPDNVWLGVTINYTDHAGDERIVALMRAKASVKFVSFEPLLGNVDRTYIPRDLDWVIVGRLTGHGNKRNPPKPWIEEIVSNARKANAAIFLKHNLKEIWGEDLIQEFPEVS